MNNYEKIKAMTIDEMAELILLRAITEDKRNNKKPQYLSFDGSFYPLLADTINANKLWLKQESEGNNAR